MTIAAILPKAHLRKLERKKSAPKIVAKKISDWTGAPGQARCPRLLSKAGSPGPSHDTELSETRPAYITFVP
eukprot:4447565-Amphidinium_carterae.2